MIVVPSDRTGAHDGPKWYRVSAAPVSGPKRGGQTGKPVILTDKSGRDQILAHKCEAVALLDTTWANVNRAIETGESLNGYRIRMA